MLCSCLFWLRIIYVFKVLFQCNAHSNFNNNLKNGGYNIFLYFTGISCGDPGDIPNGNKTGDHFYGDVVNYTCNEGYIRNSGDQYLQCEANMSWRGRIPTCTSKKQIYAYIVYTYISYYICILIQTLRCLWHGSIYIYIYRAVICI